LKTGSTSRAGFCISAAAKRDGMQLIAVVMGSPNRDSRNETAKKLLDYGFANYRYLLKEAGTLADIKVLGGVTDSLGLTYGKFDAVLDKGQAAQGVESVVELPEVVSAPIQAGDVIGKIDYKLGDEIIGTVEIRAAETVEKIGFFGLFRRLLSHFFLH